MRTDDGTPDGATPDEGRRAHPPAFALDVRAVPLDVLELLPEQVLEGHPRTSGAELESSPDGHTERGVWEITPGVVTDVEADELFVVVAGRATVEIADGPTLDLAPGVVGVLRAGDRTVWRVHETLRKVYVATTASAG